MFSLMQLILADVSCACDLPKASGKVVLTINGKIGVCNVDHEVQLDLPMVRELPVSEVSTTTPWERGRVTYQGVLLRDLLHYVKASGTMLEISALNDFHTELSVQDVQEFKILLAYRREGVDLTVRDKGPFFVVFPFSDERKLETEERFSQSIWQVSHISVR